MLMIDFKYFSKLLTIFASFFAFSYSLYPIIINYILLLHFIEIIFMKKYFSLVAQLIILRKFVKMLIKCFKVNIIRKSYSVTLYD